MPSSAGNVTNELHICLSRKQASKYSNGMSITRYLHRVSRGLPITETTPALDHKTVVVIHSYEFSDHEALSHLLSDVERAFAKVVFLGDEKALLPGGMNAMDVRRAWELRRALLPENCEQAQPPRRM